jgi:hypothetical protein
MYLKFNKFEIPINLFDTQTANEISKISLTKVKINTWGEEIYFKIPVKGVKLDQNARDIVLFGEFAYWVEGQCLAVGFGPTPASINKEIRLVTNVNIIGKFEPTNDVLKELKNLKNNDLVSIYN